MIGIVKLCDGTNNKKLRTMMNCTHSNDGTDTQTEMGEEKDPDAADLADGDGDDGGDEDDDEDDGDDFADS